MNIILTDSDIIAILSLTTLRYRTSFLEGDIPTIKEIR